MYAWPKSVVEIVKEIDDENQIGWDTDTDACILLLTGFIETHCDPAQFEKYVRAIAKEELEQLRKLEDEEDQAD